MPACRKSSLTFGQADRSGAEEPAAQAVKSEVRRAAQILRAGGLVAFPTETVYGLGADAANAEAVARLYAVKRRPADHPVILHFANAEKALPARARVTGGCAQARRALLARPSHADPQAPPLAKDFITGGQDTVGLRVPSHPVAQELLEFRSNRCPSANRFGLVSPTTAAHVRDDLGATSTSSSKAAQARSVSNPLSSIFPGRARCCCAGTCLERGPALIGEVRERAAASPRHPGGMARHYAPRTPAQLVFL